MAEDAHQPPGEPSGPLILDPFGFIPDFASRVPGLGGPNQGPDPTYVFHTAYVPAARGPANFTVRFSDLQARLGTLTLRVHMLPDEPGAAARLVNSERIQLNRLVRHGGEVTVGFEGFRGVTYAVMGLIADQTDVQATAIAVTLDRPVDARELETSFAEVRATAFGNDAMMATARMVSSKRPYLESAVSQACTAEQFNEPVYRSWLRRLGIPLDRTLEQWSLVYRLQVLDIYGLLQEGAVGLGMAAHDEPFVEALTKASVKPVLPEPGAERRIFDMDPLYPPLDLVNFDFLWSCDAAATFDRGAEVTQFAANAMACLRPGGLAVFLFPTTGTPVAADGQRRMGRTDLERLALTLVSRNNELAQVKLSGLGEGGMFGIVARKERGSF